MNKQSAIAAIENYEILPPEGDADVGKAIMEYVTQIIEEKKRLGLHDRWIKNYRLRRADHWGNAKGKSIPYDVVNIIYAHIQRSVNMLTDNNPTFNVAQLGMIDDAMKDVFLNLQRTAEYWWVNTEQQDVLETSVLVGETYGHVCEQVQWNPNAEYQMGEAEAKTLDPFHWGFWPYNLREARDLQQCEAVFTWEPVSVRKLRRQYPDKAGEIKPDSQFLSELGDERRDINAEVGKKQGLGMFLSIAGAVKEVLSWQGEGAKDANDETLVVHAWVKDYTKENGVDKYAGNIRYVKTCFGGRVVLEDMSNPNVSPALAPEMAQRTYLYDKFPMCMVNSIKDTSSAWGCSDIEQAETLQRGLDKALSKFDLLTDRAARQIIVNPLTTGVQNSDFTNGGGFINPVNEIQAQAIRYLEAPPYNLDLEKAISLFQQLVFMVLGTFDIDQAQVGGKAVIAYKAIAALIERAATMYRGKIRSYSRLIRERGRMYLSMVQNFYSEERWIPYEGRMGVTEGVSIKGTEMVVPTRLTVVTGSTMPISKVQQREEAIALAQMGAIDQEELLEKLDWSGRGEVVKRMKEGPFGDLANKLQGIGVPPQMVELFRQLQLLDVKQFQKAMEQGKLPTFDQMAQAYVRSKQGQPEPQQQTSVIDMAEARLKQAEAQKKLKEIEKIDAEKALLVEKIATERIEQRVKLAGIAFDEATLKMERAKTVREIERQLKDERNEAHDRAVGDIQTIKEEHRKDKDDMRRDREQDMTERQTEVDNEFRDREIVSMQDNKPGYEERGLKSNNKDDE